MSSLTRGIVLRYMSSKSSRKMSWSSKFSDEDHCKRCGLASTKSSLGSSAEIGVEFVFASLQGLGARCDLGGKSSSSSCNTCLLLSLPHPLVLVPAVPL